MKIGRVIIGIALALLAAGAVALFFRFFPCIQGAGLLEKNLDLGKMSFDLTLGLSGERLSEEQIVFVDTLSEITGIQREDLLRLRIKGQSWEDMLYFEVIPQGEEEPLTQMYLGEEQDVVNAAMLYHAVRSSLTERYQFLELLLPQWSGGEYVSLEQAEQMFALDLEGVKDFSLSDYQNILSYWEYFALLAVMDQEKASDGALEFSLHTTLPGDEQENDGSVRLKLRLDRSGNPSTVSAEYHVNNMPLVLHRLDALLAKAGRTEAFSQKKGLLPIESVEGTLVIGNGESLQIPDALIDQETVDQITAIRRILQEMLGK